MVSDFLITIPHLIETAGYWGLAIALFAESGLFFGFFLPGDSLLFSAGFLASQNVFNIWLLIPLLGLAAIAGDSVGYWFGAKAGPRIFVREDSFFFRKEHLARTELFFIKYGPRAIILARFIPIVRTFTPILAGVGKMRYPLFLTYNIIGGILWAIGLTLIGYFLGSRLPASQNFLPLITLVIIVISILPLVREWLQWIRVKKE